MDKKIDAGAALFAAPAYFLGFRFRVSGVRKNRAQKTDDRRQSADCSLFSVI
jgi:hypothetical protein